MFDLRGTVESPSEGGACIHAEAPEEELSTAPLLYFRLSYYPLRPFGRFGILRANSFTERE